MTRKPILTIVALCASILPGPARSAQADELPETIQATGVVRDFRERTDEGGHPDFENPPNPGLGRYQGNINLSLDGDGKPAFNGSGHKIASQWRDSSNRVICKCLYDGGPPWNDQEGSFAQPSTAGITSAETFRQWFRDELGMNLSDLLTITLVLDPVTEMYVFDDRDDPMYENLGGFFPIDDKMYGNSGGSPDHNFHFTYELHASFVYDSSKGYTFKFEGQGDIWVFIDGQLVVDLLGVHAALDQYVDLARLDLTDGETYPLDFFFAQRLRPQSSFRVETNIPLNFIPPATTTALFD